MSFDDLTKVMVFYGIVARRRPANSTRWTALPKDVHHALEDLKKQTASELEELSVLYDPEETGVVGMSDFYLLLKDLFINNKQLTLQLEGQTNNIFEAEGSYKELMAKLDELFFDEIGLCRKLYQRSKGVSIDFGMFWSILGALLQTKIMTLAIDLSPRKQKTIYDTEEDDFEDRVKKMREKISKIEVPDEPEDPLEDFTNHSNPEASELQGDMRESTVLRRYNSRQSRSQPLESKKRFAVPTDIAKQLEKNKASVSSKHNSLARMESLTGLKNQKIARQGSYKGQPKRVDSEIGLSSKKQTHDLIREIREADNQELINQREEPDHIERHSPSNHDSDGYSQTPHYISSSHNTSVLHDNEATWKKSLTEIFCFYNKLQKQTKGEYSFENFKEKMNHMSLGEWVKFCNDFKLLVPKPTVLGLGNLAESKNEHNKKVLTQVFKREAKGGLGINFSSFQVSYNYIDRLGTIVS